MDWFQGPLLFSFFFSRRLFEGCLINDKACEQSKVLMTQRCGQDAASSDNGTSILSISWSLSYFVISNCVHDVTLFEIFK